MANQHLKKYSMNQLRRYKLRPPWDATTYWLECLKLKRLITVAVVKDMGKMKFSDTASRNTRCYALIESLTFSLNKYIYHIIQSFHFPGTYQEIKVCIYEKICTQIFIKTICNNQKLSNHPQTDELIKQL